MKNGTSLLSCLLLCGVLSIALAASTYTGKVVGVHDGDTLTLLTADKQQIKVRLAEIDTPESRQPYGSRAKQALSDKVFGKIITLEPETVDRYGRVVGHVRMDDRDVNREMVREGHAWVYRQYLQDRSLLAEEQAARENRRGLWALPEAQRTPPWEWRHQAKNTGGSRSQGQLASHATCGTKRYCKEMASCEEARFYLTQCGLTRLDGDRDGTPCESLCR